MSGAVTTLQTDVQNLWDEVGKLRERDARFQAIHVALEDHLNVALAENQKLLQQLAAIPQDTSAADAALATLAPLASLAA